MDEHPELTDRMAALASMADHEIELARSALLVARSEYPDLDERPYLEQLDRLAERLGSRIGSIPPSEDTVELMADLLCREAGFRGNRAHYYDPKNSFLNEVMNRKLGIPITLSILFLEVGQRAGLEMYGMAFPGHFLAGLVTRDARIVIDPFHDGKILSMRDCRLLFESYRIQGQTFQWALLNPVLPKEILSRLMRNLKLIYLHTRGYRKALTMIGWILLLQPDSPMEHRDRGFVYKALGDYGRAVQELERYVTVDPHATDRREILLEIDRLKRKEAPSHRGEFDNE